MMIETPEKDAEKTKGSKWIAYLLDDLIKIPGTEKRIGLDPLIGLIPGAGDFLTSSAGLTLLAAGARKKIPMSVYLRMISNWSLNALVGALPFVGDVFSFWFKSNRRNYQLLRSHVDDAVVPADEKRSWLPLIILVSVATLVFLLIALIIFFSWRAIVT